MGEGPRPAGTSCNTWVKHTGKSGFGFSEKTQLSSDYGKGKMGCMYPCEGKSKDLGGHQAQKYLRKKSMVLHLCSREIVASRE